MDRNSTYFDFASSFYVLISAALDRFSSEQIAEYTRILREHKFVGRKKDDPPHPNSVRCNEKEDLVLNVPEKLARATIRAMDMGYNARTQNNVKGALVKLVEENRPFAFRSED